MKRVEDRTTHTALWYADVQYKGGGGVVVKANRPWCVSKDIQGPITEGSAVGEL